MSGVCAGGTWNSPTQAALKEKRLSIFAMELLAAAAAVHMAAEWGRVPEGRRLILRCDN